MTGRLGVLQFLGLQRVRQNLATEHQQQGFSRPSFAQETHLSEPSGRSQIPLPPPTFTLFLSQNILLCLIFSSKCVLIV